MQITMGLGKMPRLHGRNMSRESETSKGEVETDQEQEALEADLLKTFPTTGTVESAREAVAGIRKLRVGNRLGPDLTLRDLIDEGQQ